MRGEPGVPGGRDPGLEERVAGLIGRLERHEVRTREWYEEVKTDLDQLDKLLREAVLSAARLESQNKSARSVIFGLIGAVLAYFVQSLLRFTMDRH